MHNGLKRLVAPVGSLPIILPVNMVICMRPATTIRLAIAVRFAMALTYGVTPHWEHHHVTNVMVKNGAAAVAVLVAAVWVVISPIN